MNEAFAGDDTPRERGEEDADPTPHVDDVPDSERLALTALAAAGERLAFLAEASEVLAASLDPTETLAGLAKLAVPRLADWCAIDMVDDDGNIELVALAHVDPAKVEMAEDIRRRYPPDPDATSGVPNVLRTGRSELMEEIPPELIARAEADRPDVADLIRDLHLRSAMVVPLAGAQRVFGAMTFVWAESGRSYAHADLALAEDLARRASVAIENARLYQSEREARLRESDARARLQILVEAGAAMAASFEVPGILRALTGGASRRICDYSVAFLLGPSWAIVDAVGAHRDGARYGIVERMARAGLPDLDSPDSIAAQVIRTGEPILIPEVPPEQLERVMAAGEQLELARELGFASVIGVPITARGRMFGALALVRDDSWPPFAEDDVSFAITIATRAAITLDNARLYAERESMSEALQRSLLPPEFPDVPGIDIGARYLPASEGGAHIGGDFYDVFPTDDDHWLGVIGDVVGKGPEAAALMGLARYTVRTAALAEGRPSRILQTLNQAFLRQTTEQRFCTACCVRIRRSGYGARMTVSTGGHPLPVVLHENGTIDEVGSPGTILGVFEDPVLADHAVDLGVGDALVLYTDGVTDERRDDEEFGEARLYDVLSTLGAGSAREIADGVLEAVIGYRAEEHRDDIAILVMKVIS
jgi:serine phosphatase RsbU (regulator of sigma subunit)